MQDAVILSTPETVEFVRTMCKCLKNKLAAEFRETDEDQKRFDLFNLADGAFEGSVMYKYFRSHEIKPVIQTSVRNKDVYLVHSFCGYDDKTYDPNIGYMKLFLINDALKRAKARKIINLLTHKPYERQDRKDEPRVPISARLVADLTAVSAGNKFDGVVTTDMHSAQQQGFYDVAVDTLDSVPLFMAYLEEQGFTKKKLVAVSPDNGGVTRMSKYADHYGLGRVVIHKQRPKEGEAKVMHVVGEENAEDAICFTVDDLIDSGNTICEGSTRLRTKGKAKGVYVAAAHWLGTDGAEQRMRDAGVQVITTDSIPRTSDYLGENSDFLTVLTLAPMYADAILRSQTGDSLRDLYSPEHIRTLYSTFHHSRSDDSKFTL